MVLSNNTQKEGIDGEDILSVIFFSEHPIKINGITKKINFKYFISADLHKIKNNPMRLPKIVIL